MNRPKPHVIYIMSDEHRGQAMSHAGDPNVRTPVMDALAREGVSFVQARTNCPICTPARGTMFSGRHAHAGPVAGFFDVYKATSPSTATILRAEGYHTAYVGKWHCGIVHDQRPPEVVAHPKEYKGASSRTPEYHRAGFQDWYAHEWVDDPFASYYYKNSDINPTKLDGYETDGFTDIVIDYLRNYDRDEPLFLVLSVTPPHFPLVVPEQWKRFDPEALEVRPNFTDTPEMRQCLANYYAMIENLDWNIGRLLDTIRSLPEFENTLTAYFADHGEFMGSHGRHNRKEHPHEESVRIPAIFNWPGGIPARGNIDGLFSLVDLMPTTLGLLGVEIPPHNQGADFTPGILGQDGFTGPDSVLMEMVNNPRWNMDFLDWRGLVTDRWKYAFYETGVELLFDLEKDPYELDDLAEKNPQKREEMKRLLLKLLAETREPYFDVLIEHGVPAEGPVIDVACEWD